MAACEASGSTVAAAPPVPTATACLGGTLGPWATAPFGDANAIATTPRSRASAAATRRLAAVPAQARRMTMATPVPTSPLAIRIVARTRAIVPCPDQEPPSDGDRRRRSPARQGCARAVWGRHGLGIWAGVDRRLGRG